MTEDGRPVVWAPNERFRSEAERFAAYRTTDRYRSDEIEYKDGLSVIVRRLTSAEALADNGVGGPEAPASGHPDLDALALSVDERALLARWPPFQGLLNLLGGGQSGPFTSSIQRAAAAQPVPALTSIVSPLSDRTSCSGDRLEQHQGGSPG